MRMEYPMEKFTQILDLYLAENHTQLQKVRTFDTVIFV